MDVFSRSQSMRESIKAVLMANLTATMHGIAGDKVLLAKTWYDGPQEWRNTFLRAYRGLPVDDDLANRLFAFFVEQGQEQFETAPGKLDGTRELAKAFLDNLMEIRRPPTEAEIDAAWEVESASSEEGRREIYGPDGHPKALLDKLRIH